MSTYTLTLDEAETQFWQLVQRTQTTHQPIVITAEGQVAPVAVVMEMSTFERLQRREKQLFHLQLNHVMKLLEWVEKDLENDKTKVQFVESFQQAIRALWEVCPDPLRSFCATLRSSSKGLSSGSLTLSQISALQMALDLLRNERPNPDAMDICQQHLISSGLTPSLGGSDKLFQLYLDEL